MRTFLPLAFWYWLYNQLFFFLGALGFFVIHFLVAFIGFGGMDTLASGILITLYALILYKLFGRFLWRSRLQQYNPGNTQLLCASLLPLILGSIFNIFTITCFWRYCRKYLQQEIPWLKLFTIIAICLAVCTIIIYSITIMYLPDDKAGR